MEIRANTGGTGAYAPTTFYEVWYAKSENLIVKPTLAGLRSEGMNFRNLVCGINAHSNGPKVLEFNVRFGDPETQVILPLVGQGPGSHSDFLCQGKPLPEKQIIKKEFAMVVVLASKGYPSDYPKGEKITTPEKLQDSTILIHAGTTSDDYGNVISSGGRVLGAVGTGASLGR